MEYARDRLHFAKQGNHWIKNVIFSRKPFMAVRLYWRGRQILFGIKGRRWDSHPVISGFFNDYWVRPDEMEKIDNYQSVELGGHTGKWGN